MPPHNSLCKQAAAGAERLKSTAGGTPRGLFLTQISVLDVEVQTLLTPHLEGYPDRPRLLCRDGTSEAHAAVQVSVTAVQMWPRSLSNTVPYPSRRLGEKVFRCRYTPSLSLGLTFHNKYGCDQRDLPCVHSRYTRTDGLLWLSWRSLSSDSL